MHVYRLFNAKILYGRAFVKKFMNLVTLHRNIIKHSATSRHDSFFCMYAQNNASIHYSNGELTISVLHYIIICIHALVKPTYFTYSLSPCFHGILPATRIIWRDYRPMVDRPITNCFKIFSDQLFKTAFRVIK